MTTFLFRTWDSLPGRNPGKTRRNLAESDGKGAEKRCKTGNINHFYEVLQGLGLFCLRVETLWIPPFEQKTTVNIKNGTGISHFCQTCI